MSAAVLANNSMIQQSKLKQSDVERFAEFKAKRLAQKEEKKEKLAAEFPLLFGKDAKARSTVGKYANKTYPTTPKKKPLGNSITPVSKNNEEKTASARKTPRKDINNTLNSSINSKKTPASKAQPVKVIENNENKASNANKPATTTNQTKKAANKGFFHFLSSKPVVEEIPEAVISEARSKSNDQEEGIEIPTMNDFTQSIIDREALFSVISEDSMQPQVAEIETFPSRSVDPVHAIVAPENEKEISADFLLGEKVQDALDFMLESKELDATAHRRLSGQRFDVEVIKRFSLSNLPKFSTTRARSPISSAVDFHAISRDISEEEVMMLAQRSAPIPMLHISPAFSEVDAGSRMPSVMTNPTTTPTQEVEQVSNNSAPEVTTTVSAVETTTAAATTIGDCEIGDLEVLYALRNYISSLEEVTYYNNPMRNPSYLNKRKSTISDPQITIIAVEGELEEDHPAAHSPEPVRVDENNCNPDCFEDTAVVIEATITDLNTSIPTETTNETTHENKQDGVDSLMNNRMDLMTPISFLSNGIAENRVILFPRQSLFDELFKLGLVSGEVVSRIRYENHVKYVIEVQVFPVPAGVIINNYVASDDATSPFAGVSHTRMMLLKRFTDFKEFREQLLLCHEGDEDAEPIPALPSKQSMSLGRDVSEEEYLNSRQHHLNNWLSSILARQSYECDQYRDTIYDFFNN